MKKTRERKQEQLITIPSYSFQSTSDPDVFRVVDIDGDWTHYWIKSKDIYLPAVNYKIKHGFYKGERFDSWLLDTPKEEAEKILTRTGDEGSRVHDAIRDIIDGVKITQESKYLNEETNRQEKLNKVEWNALLGFKNFCEDYKPHYTVREFTVYDEDDAGTLDFIGSIEIKEKIEEIRRVWVLLDWKKSSGIRNDHRIQTADYNHKIITEKRYSHLPKSEFTGVVRIGTKHKRKYEIQLWDREETNRFFEVTKAVDIIFKVNKPKESKKDYKPEIEQIPFEIKIDIPKAKVLKAKSKVGKSQRIRKNAQKNKNKS